ncbi:hypothetical protein [Streptomyces sp. NPDC056337]|uniref:hypothetical protein n=1 Tax=Streptomyces sp. NPDC056337 TaxID=3345787 RepID=UPI0035D606CA
MNTGWVTYGILLIVAAFLVFDLRKGVRPTGIVILTGPGGSHVGILQGSNTDVDNGLIAFPCFMADA